jgi:hypothetical protein
MLPIILFGRVGIIEEAWLIFAENGLTCPVFDIEFFDRRRSELFIIAALGRLAQTSRYRALSARLRDHESVYEAAAANFVTGLERAASSDGTRFSGYAPVLEAVATALGEIPNPANVRDTVQRTLQGQVLQQLVEQILSREAAKLRAQLPEQVPDSVKVELYGRDEQLTRLGGVVYHAPPALPPSKLAPQFVGAYEAAVSGFMPNHPFLDGTGRVASGAVFSAVINAHALFSSSKPMVAAAQKHAGDGPHTPNPFLIDFYIAEAQRVLGENLVVPPEHVVALYESVRARATAADMVRLTVEGDAGEEADIEISISGNEAPGSDRRILMRTFQAGALHFGRQVNGVLVDASELDVVIGSGNPVEMIAPVSLNVSRLSFECPELVVTRADRNGNGEGAVVTLEARELLRSDLTSPPIVRKGAGLSVWWPGATAYPWSQFAGMAESGDERDISEGLRALRRLVIAFRSHSKGRLARLQDKIEHARMTKGRLGVAIRERMVKDGILSLEGNIYFLNSTALGQIVGATYQDVNMKRFNDKVRQYIQSIQ